MLSNPPIVVRSLLKLVMKLPRPPLLVATSRPSWYRLYAPLPPAACVQARCCQVFSVSGVLLFVLTMDPAGAVSLRNRPSARLLLELPSVSMPKLVPPLPCW